MDEKRIALIMKKLDCSREDAIDVIESDKEIDQGKRTYFDLEKSDEKQALKQAHKGLIEKKKPTIYQFNQPKERKKNATKAAIIAEIAKFLTDNTYEMVEITNTERMIAFKVGENDYELTLVQKRKPKK